MTHPTLIPEQNLLTEQLQAAVNHERVKLRIEDLQLRIKNLPRALMYLQIAGEATRRLVNHLKSVERYDEDKANFEPWTWILTKEQCIKRVRDTQAAYLRCMQVYEKYNSRVI